MIDDMVDDDDKMPSRLDQTSGGESDDGMGGALWTALTGKSKTKSKSKKKKKKPLTPSSVCSRLRPLRPPP